MRCVTCSEVVRNVGQKKCWQEKQQCGVCYWKGNPGRKAVLLRSQELANVKLTEDVNHFRQGLRAIDASIENAMQRLESLRGTAEVLGIQLDKILDPPKAEQQ